MNEQYSESLTKELATGSSPGEITAASDVETIYLLREAILAGMHWYRALLAAIGRWSRAYEEYEGRKWCYLIDGEAFDWLLLAERLCLSVSELIPDDEMNALLFRGVTPLQLNAAEIRRYMGEKKFRQYLNFFYGVTVEEGLILAVQEEVEKEKRARGVRCHDSSEEAFVRVYGDSYERMLNAFRYEKNYPFLNATTLGEQKEFTYWLFKYRFRWCEKARIASDTRKSLMFLQSQWQGRGIFNVLFTHNGLAEVHL